MPSLGVLIYSVLDDGAATGYLCGGSWRLFFGYDVEKKLYLCNLKPRRHGRALA